jgi:hypothetical protein
MVTCTSFQCVTQSILILSGATQTEGSAAIWATTQVALLSEPCDAADPVVLDVSVVRDAV